MATTTKELFPEPDDADLKRSDAARAVRMRLAGNRGSGSPAATLANAAATVRAFYGGKR